MKGQRLIAGPFSPNLPTNIYDEQYQHENRIATYH